MIVNPCCVPIAVFRALPKLAAIAAAGEHGSIFLRLMPKNRLFLAFKVFRADGNDALDGVGFPLLPGAAIKPDLELLAALANDADGIENRLGTNAVRTVGIRKLPGNVNLCRLQSFQ